MGLFDRFSRARRDGERGREAREKELEGDLASAVTLFVEAGLPDEAARVLLLRADAEPKPEQRIAFCALAAARAENPDIKQGALARKGRIGFDVLKSRGGALLTSEVAAVARDLEEAGVLDLAADAFALAGDVEGETRVLTRAGAIERLEERLKEVESASRADRRHEVALRRVGDLDRTAERREALAIARAALAEREDDAMLDAIRRIRGKVARGPLLRVTIDGDERTVALGPAVTIGRGEATIVVPSPAVSREHLRIARTSRGVVVEDLGGRNGTSIAGARVRGALPVGGGVELLLGGEVPCAVAPDADGVTVAIGGNVVHAPLGPLRVGAWSIDLAPDGDETFVALRTDEGAARPFLGELELGGRVELAYGDGLSAKRGGAIRLLVNRIKGSSDA